MVSEEYQIAGSTAIQPVITLYARLLTGVTVDQVTALNTSS
jgi:hypothetical protein